MPPPGYCLLAGALEADSYSGRRHQQALLAGALEAESYCGRRHQQAMAKAWQSLGNRLAIVWQYGGNRAHFVAIGVLALF